MTQGLRFTFDVRHPLRGLEGGFLELRAIADGNAITAPGVSQTSKELREKILNLAPAKEGAKEPPLQATELLHRLGVAHTKTKDVLKGAALVTDAYFLYTPSQIWLASLLLVDEPLALMYLDTKLPPSHPLRLKLLSTIRTCAEMLQSYSIPTQDATQQKRDLKRTGKKLHFCQNPDNKDLVGLNKSAKRDGGELGGIDEQKAKKRKLERQQSEREGSDMFGPTMTK